MEYKSVFQTETQAKNFLLNWAPGVSGKGPLQLRVRPRLFGRCRGQNFEAVRQNSRPSRFLEGQRLHLQEQREHQRSDRRVPLRCDKGSVGFQERPISVQSHHCRVSKKVPGPEAVLNVGEGNEMAGIRSALEIHGTTVQPLLEVQGRGVAPQPS